MEERKITQHEIGLAQMGIVEGEDGFTKHDPKKAKELLEKARLQNDK